MLLLTASVFACTILGPGAVDRLSLAEGADVRLKPEGVVHDWIILGPFPNPRDAAGNPREAFDTDYLTALGGEAKARLEEGTAVEAPGGDTATARALHAAGGVVDFLPLFPESANRLVYAYTEVRASCEGEALAFLGSDDGAKVWVNGEAAFEAFLPAGRSHVARENRFPIRLRAGTNRVLVKVENGRGDWKLSLELYGTEAARRLEAELEAAQRMRAFQNAAIGPGGWPSHVLAPGEEFPRLIWRDVDLVRELVGDVPLAVRWFDADLREVAKPKAPGRYAAVAEGRLRDGSPVRRAATFYCDPAGADLGWRDYDVTLAYPGPPFDAKAWEANQGAIRRWMSGLSGEALAATEGGAIFLAWLGEAARSDAAAGPMEAPDVRNADYFLRLKLKLAGLEGKTTPLAAPAKRAGGPAPVLHEGTAAEAGVKADAKQRIDEACAAWARDSGEPFTILVARHGVIVTHAAFGNDTDGRPLGLDFRNEIASITKALTGQLFGRFVDQGLMAIDDPVGLRLPEYPTTGPHALTYRHLFTHTSGLEGHAEFGGLGNPFLDNAILNGLPLLHTSEVHIYNGMGYDLAGKAMEYATGTSIARLMHDGLFVPLGLTEIPPVFDLAFSGRLTARELGVIAQMMLNRGCYGDVQLMSEETAAKLLPVRLREFWPAVDVEWGIGLTPYRECRAGADPTDPASLLLGQGVVGHGSATSCILRVAPEKDLIVVAIRRTAGERYDQHLTEVLTAISDSLQ